MAAGVGLMTGRDTPAELAAYQYVVLRCVPRVDREEFVNVAVVLFCQAGEYLAMRMTDDLAKACAIAPDLDPDRVVQSLSFIDQVCRGSASVAVDHRQAVSMDDGPLAQPISARFGFVKAPRSTVIQPGPVHGGLTDNPDEELDRLYRTLVG